MNDVLGQVQLYIAALWRKRWYIVPIAWVFCIGGWLAVMSLPDRYESQARIYVDTDSLLSPLLRGLSIEGNLSQQVDFMQRTLLSRPNLEKLVRMADLDLFVENEIQKDELLRDLAKRTSIAAQGQGKNLFTVAFNDKRPEVAQRVVQSLLSIFVESNLGASRTDIEKARQFLDQQIADYERQLQSSEAKLATFKRTNLEFLGGTSGSFVAKLESIKTARNEAKSALDESIARRDSLQRDVAATPPTVQLDQLPNFVLQGTGEVPLPPTLASLQTRISDAEKGLDTLLQRYTEQHPDVVRQRRQIDSLHQQFDNEKKRLEESPQKERSAGPTAPQRKQTAPNPLYEQVKLKAIDAASVAETANRRLALLDEELARAEKMANTAPAIEAEFATLNRDYATIKRYHDELTQRREAAKIADQEQTRGDKIQFRVVDPPQVPTTPSGPPRLILMSAVLAAAIGAGIAVAFIISQLDDSFISLNRLRSAVAVPVLGSVSRVLTPGERRRRILGTVSFAASLACLMLAYGYLAATILRGPISFS